MSNELLEALRQWAHQVTVDVQSCNRKTMRGQDQTLDLNMKLLEDAIQNEELSK